MAAASLASMTAVAMGTEGAGARALHVEILAVIPGVHLFPGVHVCAV